MTPSEIVQSYIDRHFKVVFWPAVGDQKGPKETDWHKRAANDGYTIAEFKEGHHRVGLVTGIEVEHGKWLHDVDIDWAPGANVALLVLPSTGFVFGRLSKPISHCFYTLSAPVPTKQYVDIDKTMLIELRGTKKDGGIGLQTMAPPSVWASKDTKQKEPLAFKKNEPPLHLDADRLKRAVLIAATGMILAKHLGVNGFGHEPRMAWAGFLFRIGVTRDELIAMGKAISNYCNNTEVDDIPKVVDSTIANLAANKKVKGAKALTAAIGHNGSAVITQILEWFGQNDFVRDAHGLIRPKHQENIKRAIRQLNHELSFNEFSNAMLIDGQRLEDPQWKSLYLEIDSQFLFQPPIEYFKMVVETLAVQNTFHPVKQYLDMLTWDGVPRVDTWLITSAHAEDTPYVRAVSSIMMIAAVRRIMHPGCKYDEMVIWESPQGADKSSAALALCPNPDWFSDDLRLNLHAQQLIEATLGKWIVEASDLAGKRKTEIEQLKAMLSRQRDGPARMAYAHFAVERPRHFILIGTTNSAIYLNDSTGSRRFWPVTIKRFNIDWIKKHRDQLWAEAKVREANGESIRLREDLWGDATKEQDARREIDPWEDLILKKILSTPIGSGYHIRISTDAIWKVLEVSPERRDRYGANRISEIMQRLGFKRTRVYEDNEVQVGYIDCGESTIAKLQDLMKVMDIPREVGEDDVAGAPLKDESDDVPF